MRLGYSLGRVLRLFSWRLFALADGYALALQSALVLRLRDDAGVAALVNGRVYDEPPHTAARPYIRIGGIEVQPLRTDCGRAATLTFSIEAHSRPVSGRVEATRCAEAVVAALDGLDLPVPGFRVVSMNFRDQIAIRDSDGKSYTALAAFTTLLDG